MAVETGSGASQGYRERLDQFSGSDAERNKMVLQLIEELESLRMEQRDTLDDLHGERTARRVLQEEKRELETKMNGRQFVVVLIDADADDYIFRERFLRNGEGGGKEAADEIHAKVKGYLLQLQIDPVNTSIVVRAYANIKSLGDACVRNGKMRAGVSFHSFAEGFTRRQALFDFVDVGAGKEEADNKIRECISFYVSNWQCKHVLLGVCHDSGYASHLGRFASDDHTRERITLLQGSTIHPRIRELGFPRPPLRLETVFAPKINSAVLSWASLAGSSITSSSSNHKSAPHKVNSNPAALTNRLKVLRNDKGRRIDNPLGVHQYSPVLKTLLSKQLCGYFYLRGYCGGCKWSHERAPLNNQEYDCLLYMTRQGRCTVFTRTGDCDDRLCIYGHD